MFLELILIRAATQHEHEDDADEPEDGFECELYHTEDKVENSSHDWQYLLLLLDGLVKTMTGEPIYFCANIHIQLYLTIPLLYINFNNSNIYYYYYRYY